MTTSCPTAVRKSSTSMSERDKLSRVQRVVIKVGSALLTDPSKGLAIGKIRDYCTQIAAHRARGVEILLVSSGAVAEGCVRLGWKVRPEAVHQLQAAAAVGQIGLAHAYQNALGEHGCDAAMIMLTHDDLADRQRYLNARATLHQLTMLGVVPVINENDTVATDEIRFGDNDTLAALVANLVEADVLVILTDVPGLMDKDPREAADAQRIGHASADDDSLGQFPSARVGQTGRGGMHTKLRAARLAARSGAHTVIASGLEPEIINQVLNGDDVGTLLSAQMTPMTARKRWIADHLRPKGSLTVDAGAARVLVEQGVSLLAVGVTAVSGRFSRGDVVRVDNQAGQPIAQGLVNYSSDELQRLQGVRSEAFAEHIEHPSEPELVHRDNLVIL